MMVSSRLQEYSRVINSFKEECKLVIKLFKQTNSDHVSAFNKLFTSRKLTLVYEKYNDATFYHDFKEDSLLIAKNLMLNYDFLGGFYLLNRLHAVQDSPKAPIRIDAGELQRLKNFVREGRSTLEPGTLFATMLSKNAFKFNFFSREYHVNRNERYQLVNDNSQSAVKGNESPINKEQCMIDFLGTLSFTERLRKVDEELCKQKRKVNEEYNMNLSMDPTPEDTLSGLINSVLEDDTTEPLNASDIGSRRRAHKQRRLRRKDIYRSLPARVNCEEGDDVRSNKKRRAVRPRALYYQVMVNNPESSSSPESLSSSSSESSSNSYLNDLDMPKIEWSE